MSERLKQVFVVLGSLCAAALLLLGALEANAAEPAPALRHEDGEGNYLRIFETPCLNDKIRAMFVEAGPDAVRVLDESMKAGEASIRGEMYPLCWRDMEFPDGVVGFIFEDGEGWMLPKEEFNPEAF